MAIGGISSGDSSNYFETMLGNKSTSKSNSSSGLESLIGASGSSNGLGDYALIQNGAYRKLLNAYYNRKDTEETAEQKKEKINLTTSSSDASALNQEVTKLLNTGISEDNREKIKEGLKSVIEKYNSLVDSAAEVDDVKVLRQALWMTQDTSAFAKTLSDIGVTVGSNNKLSLDETKFDNAHISSINTSLSGRNSYLGKLADRSALLNSAATNAVSGANTRSLYKPGGSYVQNVAGNVVDTAE